MHVYIAQCFSASCIDVQVSNMASLVGGDSLPPTSSLVAAAFGSLVNTPVYTLQEYQALVRQDPDIAESAQKLDMAQMYEHTHVWGQLGEESGRSGPRGRGGGGDEGRKVHLIAKTLTGDTKEVTVPEGASCEDLKRELESSTSVPAQRQRLVYAQQHLETTRDLGDYSIVNHATIHIVMLLPDGNQPFFYMDESLLDPNYDFDFRKVQDGTKKFYRGNYLYTRPCGWDRKALKVLGRYGNNAWLGAGGMRTESSVGEWPVSYHATAKGRGGNIAQVGFSQSQGKIYPFQRGIYTTPSASVAAKFAPTFTYKGETYQVIFQNRVNPSNLQILKAGGDEYWVSPQQQDVRPYSICLRKI